MTRPTVYTQVAFDTKPAAVPVWTDTSSYHREIHTQRGRQRELDRDEAGNASVTYNNSDRRFDPNYTSGPYYPNVKSMKRIRVGSSDPAGTSPYLRVGGAAGSYAWCSSSGIVTPADLDIRVKCALDDWTPSVETILVARATPGGAIARNWVFRVATSGLLEFVWSATQTTPFTTATSTAPGISNGATKWVRVTLDVDDGGGNWDAAFYKSDDGSSWTAIGTDTNTPTASIGSASTKIVIGQPFTTDGTALNVYEVQIRAGIAGTLQADPIFSTAAAWWRGDRVGLDAQDNIWALEGPDVSIAAGRYYLFHGFTLGWPQNNPQRRNSIATPDAVDGFHVLNLAKLTFSAVEQTTSERVDETLDEAGWSDSERQIGTGQSTAVAEEIEETPALEHLLRIADSENGRIFINKSGSVVFRGRHDAFTGSFISSVATFGDSGSEHRYLTLEMNPGEALIFNEVQVSRIGGSGYQTASDADSIEDFFRRTKTKSNLAFDSDTEALSAARWLLSLYKDERQRIEKMVVDPEAGLNLPATLWPIILGLELGDRVTVRRRPQGVGSAIEQESIIEGIEHDIGPGAWHITFALSPASSTDFGILDDAELGKLDETMRLVY